LYGAIEIVDAPIVLEYPQVYQSIDFAAETAPHL
jgi:hypothetical protein